MKKKGQKTEEFVVVHKNPAHFGTQNGKRWVADGLDRGWSYARCERHVKNCEYAEGGVDYQIIPADDIGLYIPSLRKVRTETQELFDTTDNAE